MSENRTRRLLLLYLSICIAVTLFILIWFSSNVYYKNISFLFGLSKQRIIAIIGLIIILVSQISLILILFFNDKAIPKKFGDSIFSIIRNKKFVFLTITFSLSIALLIVQILLMFPYMKASPIYNLILEALPLLSFFVSLSILTFLLYLFLIYSNSITGFGVEKLIHSAIIPVILLGSLIRLFKLLIIDLSLPFQGGGLFYEFAKQIVFNNFSIPDKIPFYLDSGLPFAYPPLAFFIEGVLIKYLIFPDLIIPNVLPPIIAVLTLPAFYLMTIEMGMDIYSRLASLIAYTLMPNAFQQLIQGAGLAEAFGSLSIIIFAIALIKAYKKRGTTSNPILNYAMVGLSWTFCVISSPGSAYGSVFMYLLFATLHLGQLKKSNILNKLLLITIPGVIVIILSAPYWVTVINNHGTEIFTSSFLSQQRKSFSLLFYNAIQNLIPDYDITGANVPFLWWVLTLIGILWSLIKSKYALVAWYILFSIIPREGEWMTPIPLSLIVGFGNVEFFYSISEKINIFKTRNSKNIIILFSIFLILFSYLLYNVKLTLVENYKLYNRKQMSELVSAMEWGKKNTPSNSKFFAIAHKHTEDWIPTVMERTVINNTLGAEFASMKNREIRFMNEMIKSCESFNCIKSVIQEETGYESIYLFIERKHLTDYKLDRMPKNFDSDDFKILWENSQIIIGVIK